MTEQALLLSEVELSFSVKTVCICMRFIRLNKSAVFSNLICCFFFPCILKECIQILIFFLPII